MKAAFALRAVVAVLALMPITAHGDCEVRSAGLQFGSYGPLDANHRDSRGTVEVACTGAPGAVVAYQLRITSGTAGTFHSRTMRQAENALAYNLFSNPQRSQVWGDGNAGTHIVVAELTIPASGAPASRDHPIFGRLFARQGVRPGIYADVLQLTVETCNAAGCQIASVDLLIR